MGIKDRTSLRRAISRLEAKTEVAEVRPIRIGVASSLTSPQPVGADILILTGVPEPLPRPEVQNCTSPPSPQSQPVVEPPNDNDHWASYYRRRIEQLRASSAALDLLKLQEYEAHLAQVERSTARGMHFGVR